MALAAMPNLERRGPVTRKDTCKQALALKHGADTHALKARGQAYLLLQLSYFDTALRISPNHMHAMYGRGMAREQLGDQAGGQSDIDEALQRLRGAGREFTTIPRGCASLFSKPSKIRAYPGRQ
jgi:hypothetical protein